MIHGKDENGDGLVRMYVDGHLKQSGPMVLPREVIRQQNIVGHAFRGNMQALCLWRGDITMQQILSKSRAPAIRLQVSVCKAGSYGPVALTNPAQCKLCPEAKSPTPIKLGAPNAQSITMRTPEKASARCARMARPPQSAVYHRQHFARVVHRGRYQINCAQTWGETKRFIRCQRMSLAAPAHRQRWRCLIFKKLHQSVWQTFAWITSVQSTRVLRQSQDCVTAALLTTTALVTIYSVDRLDPCTCVCKTVTFTICLRHSESSSHC